MHHHSLFHPCQNMPRFPERRSARLGQRNMALGALEQRHAELVFQRTDLHRQRGLRDVQLLRRAHEMQFLGER
jgi:hypothetical protein